MRREVAIGCQVVFRHSARREPLLEASTYCGAVQSVETPDGSDRGRVVLHDEAGQSVFNNSGTEPRLNAITGVP
jgi:hypothetical protein